MMNTSARIALASALALPCALSAQTAKPSAGVTVPAGTRVQLTLVTPVKSKSSRPGDIIRATVAFPVTVGAAQAIPAGAYVEGTLQSISRRVHAPQTGFAVRFTRIILPDGYSEPVNGQQARVAGDGNTQVLLAMNEAPADLLLAQVPPGFPTPPKLSLPSHTGLIVGVTVGVAAFTATAILLSRRGGHQDMLLYDAGWQFEMKLDAPLTLPPPLPVSGS